MRRRPWESPITPQRTVRITHPLFGPINAPFAIHRYSGHSPTRLADEAAFRSFGLGLHYSAYLELHDIAEAFWGRTRQDGYFELRNDLWDGLSGYGKEGDPFNHVYDRDGHRLLVAQVDVREYPARLVFDAADSWTEFMDKYDDDDYIEALQRVRSMDDGVTAKRPLSGTGSLLHLSQLAVHPLLRGQGIGRRLVAHALWENVRQDDDLATCIASPESTIFTRNRRAPAHTTKAVQRVADYLGSIGFHRAWAPEPVDPSVHEVMYRHVGVFGFPYPGLGTLSERAGVDSEVAASA